MEREIGKRKLMVVFGLVGWEEILRSVVAIFGNLGGMGVFLWMGSFCSV